MATVQTTHFNVVTCYVADLRTSHEFFETHLGFRLARPMEPGVLLEAGEGEKRFQIYIEGGHPVRPAAKEGVTRSNMCLGVKSVREAAERLKAAGVPFHRDYVELAPNFAGFEVIEPNGLIVEIYGTP